MRKTINDFGGIIVWFFFNFIAIYGMLKGWNRYIVINIVLAGGFVAISINWLVLNKRRSKLKEGVDFADAVSRGDLTRQLYVASEDEIGRLSDSLNKMVVNLKFMINQVKSTFDEMKRLIEKAYRTGEQITKSTKNQAEFLEKSAETMRDFASAIGEITRSSISVAKLMTETKESTAGSHKSLRIMLNDINEFEVSSKKIEQIVDIINDISEQTNILALNAAVESSRVEDTTTGAGSISGEIRKLAERSVEAAGNVDKLIVSSMEKIKRVFVSASKVGENLKDMSGNIDKVFEYVNDIKEMSADESEISESLIRLIESVNDINTQSLNNIEELVNATNILSSQTEVLKGMIDKFKLEEKVV